MVSIKMSLSDYAYSNTRLRVVRSMFLKKNDIETLVGVKNLKDYVSFMKQTVYGESFSKLDAVNIQGIERVISLDLMKAVDSVIGLSPESSVPFLGILSRKYLFGCIKRILQQRMSDLSPPEIKNEFFADEEFPPGLIDAAVEDIPALLCNEYCGLGEFIPESAGLVDILVGLDRYYFSEVKKGIDCLHGTDKKMASGLLAIEIDIINMMIILRSLTQGYEYTQFIIPAYKSNLDSLDKYALDDVGDILTLFSKSIYGRALKNAIPGCKETKSLLHVELALRRYLVEESKAAMSQNPFHIGFILGFLKLKEIEVENLKTICIGIGEGLPANNIRELLIMPSE